MILLYILLGVITGYCIYRQVINICYYFRFRNGTKHDLIITDLEENPYYVTGWYKIIGYMPEDDDKHKMVSYERYPLHTEIEHKKGMIIQVYIINNRYFVCDLRSLLNKAFSYIWVITAVILIAIFAAVFHY